MKRITILATIVTLAHALAGFSASAVQTTQKKSSTTLRTTRVNAHTIKALSRGKKVVADLTKRGVVYEFDAGAGQIDFNRVVVRTARGEETIGSLLETMFPKDRLRAFKYTAQSFRLGTQRPGTLSTTLMKTSNFECKPDRCICHGLEDCEDLIIGTSLCVIWFCMKDPHGEYLCICSRGI